jgi:hypothetical protein
VAAPRAPASSIAAELPGLDAAARRGREVEVDIDIDGRVRGRARLARRQVGPRGARA